MIQVSDLSYAYGPVPALSRVSFRVQAGRTVALLGANGSGKSTLLTILSGLISPGSGQVRVKDLVLPGQEKKVRRQVGLLLQDANLQILGATVGEDLLLGHRGLGAGGDGALARELAHRFGLQKAWDKPVHALSGGQKRKLCLAAMLVRRPDVLLYDEPFSGLDYPASIELRRHLRANREQGLTQVIAVHDVEPIVDLVDRYLILEQGRLEFDGPGQEVMDRLTAHGIRPPCSWQVSRGLPPFGELEE